MGCCTSRLRKIPDNVNTDKSKGPILKITEYFDDKMKSIITMPESNTHDSIIKYLENTPNKSLPVSEQPSPNKSLFNRSKTLADNNQDYEDRSINKIDILINLISIDFFCDNFISIFQQQFSPQVEVIFQGFSRTYKDIFKSDDSRSVSSTEKSMTINNNNSENNRSSLQHNESSFVDLINMNQSVRTNTIQPKRSKSIKNVYCADCVEYLFNQNYGELTRMNEFFIRGFFKREIYSPIHFILKNKSQDENFKENVILCEAFLPINYLFILPKINNFQIKIPLRYALEDITIGYLNVAVTNKNCEFITVDFIDPESALNKINSLFQTNNIQNLNDMEPTLIQKNLMGFKYNNKDNNNNIFKKSYEEVNNNCVLRIYESIFNLNLNEIQKIIYLDKKDKFYGMNICNFINYYNFLLVLNEIFGKLVGYQKNFTFIYSSCENSILIEKLKSMGKMFFNAKFFHFDVVDSTNVNLLLVNNLIKLIIKFKKEKILETYADEELNDMMSLKNIFEFVECISVIINNKLIKNKIDLNSTKNNISSNVENEYILLRNIRYDILFIINFTLENYTKLGLKKNSQMNSTNQQYYFEEIESLKVNIKKYIFQDYEHFLYDKNYFIGISRMLVNYLKFVKCYCYCNKYSHSDAYITENINDKYSILKWLINIFDKLKTDIRFLSIFFEFIYEFTDEFNPHNFYKFNKYFKLRNYQIYILPYMEIISKKNVLVWIIISKIFLKFSEFTKTDKFIYFDSHGLELKEIENLLISNFNMLVILTKDEYMKVNLDFKVIYENEAYGMSYIPQNKTIKFMLSSYHLTIFKNILETLSNLCRNQGLFKNYVKKYPTNYQQLFKYLIVFTLIRIEGDKYLKLNFSKNVITFFAIYKAILKFTRNALLIDGQYKYITQQFESILHVYLPKLESKFRTTKIMFENYIENLKQKVEMCVANLDKKEDPDLSKTEKYFEEIENFNL